MVVLKSLVFQTREDAQQFFRPGQVFSIQVTTELNLKKASHRPVDHTDLPLEPIPILQAEAEAAFLEDRKKRFADILALPLKFMIQYAGENKDNRAQVYCRLCVTTALPPNSEFWMSKED
jgi:hypothetical protein